MNLSIAWYVFISLGIIGMFVYDYINGKHNLVYSIIIKGICSALFVCLGFASRPFSANQDFSSYIITGLFIGAVADIVLDLSSFKFAKKYSLGVFVCGALLFFTGHVFYTYALLSQNTAATGTALIIAAVLLIIIMPYIWRQLKCASFLKVAASCYLLIVMVVLGSAVSLFFYEGYKTVYLVFAIAAASFLISDMVLTVSIFGEKNSRKRGSVVLYTYYAAQILIACSTLFI